MTVYQLELPPPPFPIPTEVSITVDWDKVKYSLVYDRLSKRHVEIFETEDQIAARKLELLFDKEVECKIVAEREFK